MLKDPAEMMVLEMTPEDLAEVLLIGQENNLSQWSEESYRKEIENKDSIALSIKYRRKLSGFMTARLIMKDIYINQLYEHRHQLYEAEILNIAVTENLQNRGFGQRLLSKFLEISKSRNVSEIWLEVRKTNLKAIRFYKKNGFSEHSERKNYYTNPTENALIMQKTLDFNEPIEN